jgi:hypothetical protein
MLQTRSRRRRCKVAESCSEAVSAAHRGLSILDFAGFISVFVVTFLVLFFGLCWVHLGLVFTEFISVLPLLGLSRSLLCLRAFCVGYSREAGQLLLKLVWRRLGHGVCGCWVIARGGRAVEVGPLRLLVVLPG